MRRSAVIHPELTSMRRPTELLSHSLLSKTENITLSYANSSAAKGAYQASIFYVRIEFCHEQIDTLLIQIHFICILGIESELMISDS